MTNPETDPINTPDTDVDTDVDIDRDINPQGQRINQHLEAASTFAPTIHLHLPPNESGEYKIELNVTMDVKDGKNLGTQMRITTKQVIE